MSNLIELENVGKFYGNIIALQGVTTTVNAGEVTCVLGDNGAGKSTLIKILAGVHDHSEGTFTLGRRGVRLHLPPAGARPGHRRGLSGPGDGAADVGMAELLPRR